MGAHLMASGTVAPISTSTGPGEGVAEPMFHYADEGAAQVVIYATPKAAATGLVRMLSEAAAAAIKAKGSFTLVLSGGSLVNSLAALADAKGAEFDKWWVFWVDERNVPLDDADSNYLGASDAFLSKVPIPAAQVVALQPGLPVRQAAAAYEGRLLALPPSVLPRTADARPVFDAVLLGVGPDGHVASLFPNAPETAVTDAQAWVLPVDNSPKPPPQRITMTLPVINAAKDVIVVALGEGKAEIVQRVLEVQSLPGALPAQLVRPNPGALRWVLDAAAAAELNISDWEGPGGSKAFPRNK
jgi:6-phosphogluconolactonase